MKRVEGKPTYISNSGRDENNACSFTRLQTSYIRWNPYPRAGCRRAEETPVDEGSLAHQVWRLPTQLAETKIVASMIRQSVKYNMLPASRELGRVCATRNSWLAMYQKDQQASAQKNTDVAVLTEKRHTRGMHGGGDRKDRVNY